MEKPFLYVALDFTRKEDVRLVAGELKDVNRDNFGYKVNLDFFFPTDLDILEEITGYGRRVFADLKMWNGKRTMKETAKTLKGLGVNAINAYCHAGVDFLKNLKESIGDDMELYGVTVLTHYTDNYCREIYRCDLRQAVQRLAPIAHQAGCDGVIVPGTALDAVSGLNIKKIVSAIRSEWYKDRKDNYQEQTITPDEAIKRGANILVCGSPITKSEDKIGTLIRVLDEMEV